MIDNIVDFLNKEITSDGYYVKKFSNLLFGKDKNDNIICATKNETKEQSFSLTTKAIELYQNYNFIFNTDGEDEIGNYDMILLKNTYSNTKKTFVNLCLNFYDADSAGNIVDLTNDLIELYKINKYED